MFQANKDFRRRSGTTRRRRADLGNSTRGRLWTGESGRLARLEALEDRRLLAVVPFGSIASQLFNQLGTVENRVVSALNQAATGSNSTLPLVGDEVGRAARAISGFQQSIHTAISSLGSMTDPEAPVLQGALFGALGPGGLNVLGDRNGNGVDLSDIVVTAPGGVLNDDFTVQMRLQGTVAAPSSPLALDLGLPGLPFSVVSGGTLNVSVQFQYELAFSFDAGPNTVALLHDRLLPGTDDQLALAVTAALANFEATARMGFVQGDLTTIPGQANGLSLNVGLSGLNAIPQVDVAGTADLNLRLSGNFAGTDNDFPGIDSDLHLHWVIDSENPNAAPPQVWFDNVYLDLGKFLSNVVQPVFEQIHVFTQPLDPVLEVLGYPLPGLSQLSRAIGGDDVDLLDLGGVAATVTGFGPIYDLVHKVLDVIDKLNDFELGETVRLSLGGFDLAGYDLRTVPSAGNVANLNLRNLTDLSPSGLIGVGQSLASKVDELPLTSEQKELVKGFAEQLNNGFNISFPILEDPASAVFPMLLGRDGDLFTLDAEMHLTARGSVATGLFGLRQVINHIASGSPSPGQIAEDVLRGFYVASDSFLEIAGGVHAGVGASVGIFSAVVGGFVSTGNAGEEPVSIRINDPNGDGKLRYDEVGQDSLDLSGELVGELGIEVRVGFEAFGKFIGVKKRFDIAREVILDFDPGPDDPNDPDSPILASQPDANGHVTLYIGPFAHLREGVDNEDGDEKLRIDHVKTTEAGETIDITIRQKNMFGIEYDVTQRIAGVRSISGIGGLGNLTIDVLPGVTSNVDFEGGTGHAELSYHGSGSSRLKAGELASELIGGLGDSILIGGPGDDTISLGHGLNTVTGGAGSNTIIVNAPTTQGGTIVGGDTDNSTLVVLSGPNTTAIDVRPYTAGAIRLSYEETTGHFPNLVLTRFDQVSISVQDTDVDLYVGDLSSGGIQTVFINVPDDGPGGGTSIWIRTPVWERPSSVSCRSSTAIRPKMANYSSIRRC
jgi:hypothetical protein